MLYDILRVERPSFFMEIIAYTTINCFYCDQLKELMDRANVEYTKLVTDIDFTREEFKEKFPNSNGFPHVIIDGEEIGGLVPTAKFMLENGLVTAPKK